MGMVTGSCYNPLIKSNIDSSVIECNHKYDNTQTFRFYEGNIARLTINDVITFHVVDINKEDMFLNIYEIENYKCTN
jgi:hypothetical protein